MSKHTVTKKLLTEMVKSGKGLKPGSYRCETVYVMPRRELHDSGFHMMVVAPTVGYGLDRKVLGIAYAGADVLNFEGLFSKDEPLCMDVPELGLMCFWASSANLKVEVVGWSTARIEACP